MRRLFTAAVLALALVGGIAPLAGCKGGMLASSPDTTIDAGDKAPVLIDATVAGLYSAIIIAADEDAITPDQAEAFQDQLRLIRGFARSGSIEIAESMIKALIQSEDFRPVSERVGKVGD